MPQQVADAAYKGGWSFFTQRPRQTPHIFRITLKRGDLTVVTRRDRWRHTTGRAYRGNALTGIFRTQRQIATFLTSLQEHRP